MRGRELEHLDPWLQRLQDGTAPALQRFAGQLSANFGRERSMRPGQDAAAAKYSIAHEDDKLLREGLGEMLGGGGRHAGEAGAAPE